MTNDAGKTGRVDTTKIDLLKHAKAQLDKQKSFTERKEKLQEELAKIEEQRKQILERQKAAHREERLVRPSIEASKGALAARMLLSVLASMQSARLIEVIDSGLAAVKGPEADRIRQSLGDRPLSCSNLAGWLDVPFDKALANQPAEKPGEEPEQMGEDTAT